MVVIAKRLPNWTQELKAQSSDKDRTYWATTCCIHSPDKMHVRRKRKHNRTGGRCQLMCSSLCQKPTPNYNKGVMYTFVLLCCEIGATVSLNRHRPENCCTEVLHRVSPHHNTSSNSPSRPITLWQWDASVNVPFYLTMIEELSEAIC